MANIPVTTPTPAQRLEAVEIGVSKWHSESKKARNQPAPESPDSETASESSKQGGHSGSVSLCSSVSLGSSLAGINNEYLSPSHNGKMTWLELLKAPIHIQTPQPATIPQE
ncbi:hypothetical protein PCASD_07874 [Puccinia coronata f. sp. avenae]|uniref:Uncharacterized protein n=1 Tax=Puccinia coronata f. sp. avenae TaxID=200324 RepID=A0A2N5UQ67_9BASI|nr:hypothetical protein PCASD_07874 [Puccinia coronata f. sp. avenae]